MLTNTSDNSKSVKGLKDSGAKQSAEGESSKKEKTESERESWYKESSGARNHIPSIIITRGKSESHLKTRSRSRDEYGMGRGRGYNEEKRGSYRGRAGGGRREDDSGYFPRSRFQESLSKGKNSNGTVSSGKYSNCNDNYSNKSDHGNYIGLPEDSRISATLRRMLREEDEDKFISLCKLLQDSLSLSDNTMYIRRSLDMILDNLLELLRTGPTNVVRLHTSKCLGRLGFNLEKDFKRFMDWIFNKYSSEKEDVVRTYLMKGILEATRLDDENRKLADFSQVLMTEMQQTMESTDVGEIFIATAEVILTLTKLYPETFTTHFRDTIDIIVGWHIDSTQPPNVTKFASRALKELAYFWRQDMSFTVSLLNQFLEDVENFGDELSAGGDSLPPHEAMDKIMSFVKVYNSVFKGLGKDMNPSTNRSVTWTFLCESLTKVLMSVMKALEIKVHQELLIAGNKCALSITNFLQSKTSLVQDILCKYIFMQLERGVQLKINTAGTLLNLISRVVESLDMRLTEEIADKLFSPGSYLLSLRFTSLQANVIQVYHSFLKLKNIPLLKKAYSHMLGDLEAALRVMSPNIPFSIEGSDISHSSTEYTAEDSQVVVLFHFRAISERAKKSNSLICMWLLQPSIFELLAVKLPPMLDPQKHPELHYSLFVLLRSHCMRHQHYVLSSGLLNSVDGRAKISNILGVSQSNDNQMTISPSTSYLATILTLLGDSLHQTMSEQSKLYVLSWARVLLEKARPYLSRLIDTPELQRLLAGLCTSASDPCQTVALHAVQSIIRMLSTYTGHWPPDLACRLMDLCVFYFNSTHPELREKYSQIITFLPSMMVIFGLERSAMNPKSACRELFLNQYSHMIAGDTGEMQTINFRIFMSYLLQGKEKENFEWLGDMVTRCWPVMESPHGVKALNSIQTITEWAAWHSAQLCVDLKLRTPLGKPLETFMAIEGMIRSLAKETLSHVPSSVVVAGQEEETGVSVNCQCTMTRARLLVQFMEQLEKAIYNAAEGTSTAMQSVARPVKTFFLANKSTCYEWMARIRLALLVVCLHCGLATSAVRHGYALLQTLLDNENTQSNDFESTLVHVGWALAAIGEAEAVEGLYVWSRDTARVKHAALRPLIDQAARRYELAAEGYESLAKNKMADLTNKPPKSENDVKHNQAPHSVRTFIADQLSECYLALTDWESLEQWKIQEEEFLANENGSSAQRYKYIKPNYLGALRLFEKEEFVAASSLLNWECLEESESSKRTSWDCSNIISETNHTLMNIAISTSAHCIEAPQKCCTDSIEKCKKVIDHLLREGVRDVPSELLSQAALLKIVTSSLTGKKNLLDNPIPTNTYIPKRSLKSPVMGQVLWWCYAINNGQQSSQISQNIKSLSIEVGRSARREGNLKLAKKALLKHLNGLGLLNREFQGGLKEMASALTDTGETTESWSLDKAVALSELAKQLHSCGEEERGMEICVSTVLGLHGLSEEGSCEKGARLLLRLVNWAQATNLPVDTVTAQLSKVLSLEGTLPVANFISDLNEYPIEDEEVGIGRVLKLSVTMWPGLGKAWGQLGSWAWSRPPQPQFQIPQHLLPHQVQPESVLKLLTSARPNIDPDDIEVENSHSSESVMEQLSSLAPFTEEQLEGLVELWSQTNAKIYNYYKLSAYAYFKYLQICDPKEEGSLVGVLRVLRLVLRAAVELQGVLEEGLASTPTAPWVPIVPQLFARLDHPAPYARRRISDLLTRIGADSPHLITFQAVVGSHTGASTIKDMPQTKLFSTRREIIYEIDDGDAENSGGVGLVVEEEDEEEELMLEGDEEEVDEDARSIDEDTPGLENSFQAIVDALEKQSSEAISEVRLLVSELRRITLLWDELWLGTLSQHHSDISRRFLQLDAEVKATDANQSLSQNTRDHLVAEKHRLILKPLLFVLEQLNSITSVTPETPHEKWFQEKYGKNIDEVLRKMREPGNPRATGEAWHLLKELQLRLVARSCKRSSYSLGMDDISPALAKLRATRIAMPGVPHPVTISSVVNYVAVLPTKTKPKKIVFNGSDGNTYTYLFKGLEDLHLDERIMQFLSIANTMLGGSGELRAHHYSVIPLGPRSGLISWVDDVTPIFSFYKRWQHREASNNTEASVMRPSELYYSKLTPLLKEAGLAKVDPLQRKKWSVSILKKVLVELMSSTPTYLLSKELWCHSPNAGAWWQSTKLYSTSLAVMSIIGYIIGLGDRHLDNVLVNLQTGEVVHIDYNVCFEKGKTLRVPEKVPFRLTPNFRAALGVTGIEGIYRLTCEHVLEVLKKGRVTLLTLLEAFVYDPLIDWTPLNEAGFTGAVYGGGRELALETKQSRRQLEKEVTCSMFLVRLTEAKTHWLENRRLLLKDVTDMIDLLEQWLKDDGSIRKAQQCLQESHSQMAILKEAEAQPQHSLYSLAQRYGKHMSVNAAQQSAINALKARIQESDMHLATYQVTVTSLRGPDIGQWISEVSSRPKKDICLVFDLIKEFLQNAGQNLMVQQCIESEREVSDLCAQQSQLTLSLLEMLVQYGKISSQYPASYIHHHRASLYKAWATSILSDMTPNRCEQVLAEMKLALNTPDERARQASSYQSGLRKLVGEARGAARPGGGQSGAGQSQASLPQTQEYHHDDPTPLLAVVLTALAALNKRFLMMEAAATSAGDRLLDLTSRDGDWFLEDMCIISGAAVTLSHLLPPSDNQEIQTALKCIQHAHAQYKALQEMHVNFTGIILGEALQALQFEEPSVLAMIDRLDQTVASVNTSLPELINQLQLHLRFTVMGMKSPHDGCEVAVAKLQEAFNHLVVGVGPLSQGDMLLMGFHGLFTNLALGSQSLVSHFTSLQCPPAWKHVDQIREAKSFAVPICDASPRSVLDMMFFVKSVSTISDSLKLMVGEGKAFRGEAVGGGFPQDHMALARPVRRFIADYISFRLLGVFSQSLAITICHLLQSSGFNVTSELEQKDIGANSKVPIEELCKKMVERRGLNTGGQLSEASGVVSGAEAAWRRSESEARVEREASSTQARLHRLQLAMTAHHWLHEHCLVHLPQPPISRASLMLELRKTTANLFTLQSKLKDALEQQQGLVTSIEQRLKWASGANPALSEVMSAFESSVGTNKEKISSEQSFAMFVANMCTSVLTHEALRTPTTEALSNDTAFARLIEECEKSYYLVKNNMIVITPEEEGLVGLLPPRKNIDSEWISKAEEMISESVRKLNSEMEPLQKALMASEENVKAKATNIRALMSKHHRIISDARALLKSMVKFEDAGLVGLEDYLASYKEYTETMSKVTKCLSMSEKLTETMVREGQDEMKSLKEKTDLIYEDLLKFKVSGAPAKRPPLLRQATVCESPRKPPITNRGVQERNAYAVSVWRRVKMKLEGRDPDPGVRSTVQQQVDWVISEATSLENLAVLYEGWTPWV